MRRMSNRATTHNNFKIISLRKKKLTRALRIRNNKKINYVYKSFLYPLTPSKHGAKVWFIANFQIYLALSKVFIATAKDKKYTSLYSTVFYKNYLIRTAYRRLFDRHADARLKKFHRFLYSYNILFFSIYLDVFYFSKKLHLTSSSNLYRLVLTFRQSRFFVNLLDNKKRNYVSVSTGLFIKFFEKKKSLKRGKNVKMLMAKYFRKILLISKVYDLVLVVKRTPVFLPEIINLLNQPIAHKFLNPLENTTIDETEKSKKWVRFFYFIFLNNASYVKNKTRLAGRVKRKIRRKVIFGNHIVD